MDITAIAIVSVICWAIVSIYQERSYGKKSEHKSVKALRSEYDEKISMLNDRIATLETIVTDEKYNLKRQFDAL